jgi:hypothetical protein
MQRQTVHFLHERTPHVLETHSKADFELWNHFMLQASSLNQAIRHGVVSFNAYYESLANPANALQSIHEARKHHANSVSSASRMLSSGHLPSTDEILLLCMILHALDLFRHRFHDAYTHLHAAVRIVDSLSPSQLAASSIAAIVNRLRKQPQSEIDSVSMATSASTPLADIDIAWKRLMNIHGWICSILSERESESVGILPERFQLQLLEWKLEFDEFCKLRQTSNDKFESRGLRYLGIVHGLIDLAIVTVARGDPGRDAELLARQADSLVERLLDDCSVFVGVDPSSLVARNTAPRSVHFGFDTELILIIIFLATSTQLPHLRQKAITLLRSAHRQEGSWDSFYAAHIIECLDRANHHGPSIISTVSYFHDHTGQESSDFCRPNLACCRLRNQDDEIIPVWFHCSCNSLTDCRSDKLTNMPSVAKTNEGPGPAPVWEHTEFTPSIVTQILSAAYSFKEKMPYHFGSAMIVVKQDSESPRR